MAAADMHDAGGWPPPGRHAQGLGKAGPRRVTVTSLKLGGRQDSDRAHAWLRSATIALAVLAAAAAAVSWNAQYVLVRAVKQTTVIAALEAGIPDVGALIFAALGIALALHGKRAIRARALNVACVGISLAMNALASTPGWRDLAIWVMPSAVYALASDTLIGVIRARAVARIRQDGQVLADDEATPMAIVGGLLLWLLRLALAPPSTISRLMPRAARSPSTASRPTGSPALATVATAPNRARAWSAIGSGT